MHLLAAHWNPALAWLLTGLGIYSAVWMLALGRSFGLRPGFVTESEIVIRYGLLFTLRIPRESVSSIQREPIAGAVPVPRRGKPNLYISLNRPLEAELLFGLTRRLTAIALCVDAPMPVF